MANLNTMFLGVLVLLLAALAVFNGLESRQPVPTYKGQSSFAVLFAAAAIGLVLYKMRTP